MAAKRIDWRVRTLRLRATLRDVRPEVWRAFVLPESTAFSTLHDALQLLFGWKNIHLHQFRFGDREFEPATGIDRLDRLVEDYDGLTLESFDLRAGDRFQYVYDFGDDWMVEIVVTVVEDAPRGNAIECTEGAGAEPPEDCGGPTAFSMMMARRAGLRLVRSAEVAQRSEGDVGLVAFDLAKINARLRSL